MSKEDEALFQYKGLQLGSSSFDGVSLEGTLVIKTKKKLFSKGGFTKKYCHIDFNNKSVVLKNDKENKSKDNIKVKIVPYSEVEACE